MTKQNCIRPISVGSSNASAQTAAHQHKKDT